MLYNTIVDCVPSPIRSNQCLPVLISECRLNVGSGYYWGLSIRRLLQEKHRRLLTLHGGWVHTCDSLVLTDPRRAVMHSHAILLIYPATVLWLVAARIMILRSNLGRGYDCTSRAFCRCLWNVWKVGCLFWEGSVLTEHDSTLFNTAALFWQSFTVFV